MLLLQSNHRLVLPVFMLCLHGIIEYVFCFFLNISGFFLSTLLLVRFSHVGARGYSSVITMAG